MDRTSRRRFLGTAVTLASLGVLAGCGMLPPLGPSPARVRRIVYFAASYLRRDAFDGVTQTGFAEFQEGLRELGYVEGRNVELLPRAADMGVAGDADARAEELPQLQPDLVVASGTRAAFALARAAVPTPVVFVDVGAPVETGLVESLARPGRNFTGLSSFTQDLAAKRLELLKEAAPNVSRPAVLWNATDAEDAVELAAMQAAAPRLGLQVRPLDVRAPQQLLPVLNPAIREGVDALIPIAVGLGAGAVATTAVRARLPTMGRDWAFAAAYGGLLALGPSYRTMHRRAATYVDKILRGVKPADLPVEQPTTFDFVVNLRTAQALGLTIPPSVLAQATEAIQ